MIAGYRACERPSAATKARIGRVLASAEAETPAPARRASQGRAAPWVAVAAAALLLLAWGASWTRPSDQRSRERGELSSFAATAGQDYAPTTRSAVAGEEPPREPVAPAAAVEEPPRLVAPVAAAKEPPRPVAPAAAVKERRQSVAPAPGPTGEEPLPSSAHARRRKPVAGPTPPVAADPGAAMLEEMALLQRAREALRGQRPDEALALLDRHGDAFPRGALAEERQALRVAALCDAGESQRGLAAGAAFARAYPRSPYADRVLSACPETQNSSNHPHSP